MLGTVPVMKLMSSASSLLLRARVSNRRISPRLLGIVPERKLKDSCRSLSAFKLLMLSVIRPVRRLPFNLNVFNRSLVDGIGSSDPDSRLYVRDRCSIFGMLKKLGGMLPDILLPLISNVLISDRLPSGVKEPSSPHSGRLIEMTRR